jgi:hypothetical protein
MYLQLSFELTLLLCFVPEMVPLFPLRHTTAPIQQGGSHILSGLFSRSFEPCNRSFDLLRFIFRTALWLDLLQPELLLSFRRAPDRLGTVRHGKRTIRGGGQQ